MSYCERAHWGDVRQAIRMFEAGEAPPFAQAIKRYTLAPKPRHAGESALDLCCGSGQGALILADLGYDPVWATDRHHAAAAALDPEGVLFSQCDFDRYLPPDRPDLICLCDALEHLPDPASVLERAAGWLAPEGRLWLVVPLEGAPGRNPNPYHVNYFTRESLLALLAPEWEVLEGGSAQRSHAPDFKAVCVPKRKGA